MWRAGARIVWDVGVDAPRAAHELGEVVEQRSFVHNVQSPGLGVLGRWGGQAAGGDTFELLARYGTRRVPGPEAAAPQESVKDRLWIRHGSYDTAPCAEGAGGRPGGNVKPQQLTDAQMLKFELLDKGLVITPAAVEELAHHNRGRSLSPHDYASTSGVILNLEDEVWVNAPIELYNPNFVSDTPYRLDFDDGFLVEGAGLSSRASFWLQPQYHGEARDFGPLNNIVVTHGDRARLSPVRSCSMTCTFCNIPYESPLSTYQLKPVDALLEAARVALADPRQPARHVLISGGTPKPKDVPWMQELYAAVLGAFPGVEVDLMMVPLPGLFDLPRLSALGLHELSINIELFNRDRSRVYSRQKYNQGLDFYLDFIEEATEELGPGRARSMLMVGLEPVGDTLAGVRAIAERGGTPVLSPFRPDPGTPLSTLKPPTAALMRDVFERAREIVSGYGILLGPDCPPCSHNTLSFANGPDGRVTYPHAIPDMLGGPV